MDRNEKGSTEEVSSDAGNGSTTPVKSKKPPSKEANTVVLAPLKTGTVEVTIEGLGELIMHKFSEKGGLEQMRAKQWQIEELGKKKRDAKDPIALFVASAHTMPGSPPPKVKGTRESFLKFITEGVGEPPTMSGKFCIPFAYVKGAMETAATDANGITKAMVMRNIHILEEWIPLKASNPYMREDLVRLKDMNRTADIRYRAAFASWEATFHIQFNEGVVTLDTVVNLLNLGGFNSGLGEWRPEKGGVKGKFRVRES